ncbi:PadR family transcriptional regulator [Gemmatimonadota bacterium]
MTSRRALGEFEQLLLLAIMRLGDDAYGVAMRREIEERTGRTISPGAIYPTMDRLELKGYVSSYMGEPTRERGGRSRRHFKLERAGVDALWRTYAAFSAMWEGFEPEPERGR